MFNKNTDRKVYSTQYKASIILIYGYTTYNSNNKFGFLQVLIPNQTPEIVWLGKTFNKHVGNSRFDGQQIDLRELQHFTISNLIHSPEHQIIQIRSLSVQLDISLEFGTKVMFKGHKNGDLSRAILHQTDALIDVSLTWKIPHAGFKWWVILKMLVHFSCVFAYYLSF